MSVLGLRSNGRFFPKGQLRAQWMVAIHPDFASYHPRLGLRLGEGGPELPQVPNERPVWQAYDYQFETWEDHTERIVKKVRAMQSSYTRGVERLAAIYEVPEAWIERLVEITCALHDVGKLATEWQKPAWLWQDHKDARARAAGRAGSYPRSCSHRPHLARIRAGPAFSRKSRVQVPAACGPGCICGVRCPIRPAYGAR